LDISFIIGFVLFLVAAVLIFKVIKKVLFSIFLVFLLFIVSIAGVGYFVYQDVMEIGEKFSQSSNLIILEDEENIISALQLSEFDFEGITFLDDDWIINKQAYFKNRDYKEIIDRNYKMMVISSSMFSETEDIDMDGSTLSSEQVFEILRAEDPMSVLLGYFSEGEDFDETETEIMKQSMQNEFGSLDIKPILFGMMLGNAVKDNPLVIVDHLKQGNIMIYPETITIKLAKSIPGFLYEMVSKNMMSSFEKE